MSTDTVNALITLAFFVIFLGCLLASSWKLAWLYVGYRLGLGFDIKKWRTIRIERTDPPFLLLVVLVFVATMTWPWMLVFGVRIFSQVFGLDTSTILSGNTIWYLITGVPPTAGAVWFTWAAYRKIDRQ